jgi:hypothetical protein
MGLKRRHRRVTRRLQFLRVHLARVLADLAALVHFEAGLHSGRLPARDGCHLFHPATPLLRSFTTDQCPPTDLNGGRAETFTQQLVKGAARDAVGLAELDYRIDH